MPDVNLIRGQREAERRTASTIRQLYIAAVIAFAAGALGFSVLAARGAVLKGEIKDTESRIAVQTPTVKKIERCQAELGTLKPKLTLLADCQDEIMDWHAICCSLSLRLSPETWLTSLDIEQIKGQGTQTDKKLTINGLAFTHTRVGETMLALNSVPEFAKLELQSTKRVEVEQEKVLEFKLAATLRQRGGNAAPGESGGKATATSEG
jgi:Tfp pilus assembly protein PilN